MPASFGERLKKLRESNFWTQQQLGEKLNVSDATVNRYEKGVRSPDLDTLTALADIFQISADYLLGRQVDAAQISETPARYGTDPELPEEARKEIADFTEYVKLKYQKK